MTRNAKAYRAAILHSIADPAEVGVERSYEYFEDGLLLVEDGKVARLGDAETLLGEIGEVEVFEYRDALITPGFIDTHIHFPQTGMIASYGEQLLEWLNTYTFPTERQFGDQAHADQVAEIFLQELLRNGTTTALVFGSVHRQSVESLFEAARRLDLRLIAGKVMMDRNAPDYLTDTAESSYRDSKALIERWHGQGRLLYAVTPRFAPTSTAEQLDMAARLLREHPGVYLHTHLSENLKEIEWVKELFPERSGYLDVYDHHGLLGPRSVFAHGVHLCDGECQRLAETGSAVAFCPTSNLFLGSGLFDLPKLERYNGVPAMEILGEPAPGLSSGDAMAAVEEIVKQLPKGVGYSWTGLSYEERLSGSQAPALYALSLLVVFLCLAALYESWSIPFSVMLVVPLGVIGALLATSMRGLSNDVFFQVGLLTTIGLSAKNAILIVEFAKELHEQGKGIVEAAIEACRMRLRPIVMTSLAFILGVVPLAISTGAGSGSQHAIGTGVIGGMVTATVLAIFWVPLFYVAVSTLFKDEASKQQASVEKGQ